MTSTPAAIASRVAAPPRDSHLRSRSPHIQTLFTQPCKIRSLVGETLFEQQLGFFGRSRLDELTASYTEVERLKCSHAKYAVRSLGDSRTVSFSLRIVSILPGEGRSGNVGKLHVIGPARALRARASSAPSHSQSRHPDHEKVIRGFLERV